MPGNKERFYYKGNRLKQLRAFCYAVRYKTLSKAAEALFLSQPTISLQISALEQELEATLFERRGRTIELTPEGAELYQLASPLLDGMENLPTTFNQKVSDMESQEINIAAGESTILYLLPEIIEAFQKSHPDVYIRLHNVSGKHGMTLLRDEKVDFAVGSMLEVPPDINYDPIYTYSPALIMPIGHPLAEKPNIELHDISPYGLILPPKGLTTWRLIDLVFQENNTPYHVAMEAGGWEVIKSYVALGLGISIVTDICLTNTELLVRKDLSAYFPKRSYGVVNRKGKYLVPQARRFIQLIRSGRFSRRRSA